MTRNEFGALDYPYAAPNAADWTAVDDEPWLAPNADITAGAAIYTGAWITGALLVAAGLVAVLVWRWLR